MVSLASLPTSSLTESTKHEYDTTNTSHREGTAAASPTFNVAFSSDVVDPLLVAQCEKIDHTVSIPLLWSSFHRESKEKKTMKVLSMLEKESRDEAASKRKDIESLKQKPVNFMICKQFVRII